MNFAKYVVLLSALSILFALSALVTVYAQGNVSYSGEPKFLAIQNAQSGSISKINDTAYTLELKNISKKTILFSDRPDRIVKSISTSDFVGNWSSGADSFGEDAPNAVLVVDELEGHDNVIVELFNPVYNANEKMLRYELIPNNTTMELANELGESTLVVDASPTQVNPQITD